MKFTAAFAILAAFTSTAVVSAAPAPVYDSLIEARSEFVEGALEEVWARFYDELLETYESRAYAEDVFERSPMIKKFVGDFVSGLAQKTPGYVDKLKKTADARARASVPRMANVVKQAQLAAKPTPAKIAIPPASKWHTVKKPSVMAEIKKLGKK